MRQYDLLPPPRLTDVRKTTEVSPCGRYRYQLTRTWSDAAPVCWIMLNPSTADAEVDDPTIRRCMDFARRWGYGGIIVANLFAWRATFPRELVGIEDPIGPENDRWLIESAGRALGDVMCGWGAHGWLRGRGAAVIRLLLERGTRFRCLGTTKEGGPRHPLYIRRDKCREPYR